ncbi:MAG: carbohydrate kinase, partial [Lachnospiraceae bacterium]|nr:carbohydrate kinase [Lachnospiraceae bacterium]
MERYLVGIDIGTSGCKTCLFDTEGTILGECYIEYPCYYPHPGWVEQKSEDVIPACFESIRTAVEQSGVDRDLIAAMAVSAQGATISMMDENGDLVRDFVVWQDIRGAGIYP